MTKNKGVKTKEEVIDQKLMKDAKKREEKKEQPPLDIKTLDGMSQVVISSDGTSLVLYQILGEKDVWQSNGKFKKTIMTHGAIQKIADYAGVSKSVKYTVLTQPDAYNNYQYTIQAEVCLTNGSCATELGEANRNNLGAKGRSNPANMAQKRAYDRAVLRLLNIRGLLSEEELSDNEQEKNMDQLSPEDSKGIAPIINQLLLAKDKQSLNKFNADMKLKSKSLNPEQLDYLRKLYMKTVAEQAKTKF